MIKLIISQGQEVYWIENFQELDAAQKWLESEMSRPYWKKDFSVVIEDRTEEMKASAAAIEKQRSEKQAFREEKLKVIKTELTRKRSLEQTNELLNQVIEFLGIIPEEK